MMQAKSAGKKDAQEEDDMYTGYKKTFDRIDFWGNKRCSCKCLKGFVFVYHCLSRQCNIFRSFMNPFKGLTILWFLCGMYTFFNQDLLKLLPGNIFLQSYGRARKPTVFHQNDTYPEISAIVDPVSFGNGQ